MSYNHEGHEDPEGKNYKTKRLMPAFRAFTLKFMIRPAWTYVDSSNPGPSARCTSRAHPITR